MILVDQKDENDEAQQLRDMIEEEKQLTNKWLNNLEETLLKLSRGKINITHMGATTKALLNPVTCLNTSLGIIA